MHRCLNAEAVKKYLNGYLGDDSKEDGIKSCMTGLS